MALIDALSLFSVNLLYSFFCRLFEIRHSSIFDSLGSQRIVYL
nr:MAG TPA: hypothetical protein [Caudoviricetes sp.]